MLPNDNVLKTSQDRLTEKSFFKSLNIQTANFHDVTSQESLLEAVETVACQRC